MPRTWKQTAQDVNKDRRTGRYRGGPACDACGRSAGHDYLSHPATDGPVLNGRLLVVCRRRECASLTVLPADVALAILAKREG